MAVANYEYANGHYPPAYLVGPDGRPWHSWRVLILPYIEGQEIYDTYHWDEPWDGPNNRLLAERMPRLYGFSSDRAPGNTTTNYLAVVGRETVWPGADTTNADAVKDGLESTVLVVENRGAMVHWMEPRDLEFATMDFEFERPNGIGSPYSDPAVAMLDGSIVRLRRTRPEALRALLTIAGGEPLEFADDGWQVIPDGRLRPLKQP